MSSYEAIRARLNHVIRFVLERFSEDHPCSAATTDEFVNEFRAWLTPQPVSWTNNAGQITVQHVRTISSVEDSIHQLRAVLNFAVKKQRSDAKPLFTTKTRSVVSKPIRTRASLDQLAAMVAYAAEPDKRREGLLRFLVASICTAARPDTLFDMSIDPERCQYDSVQNTFDLNPHGRTQTKKYRPVVPVLPPLKYLIETTTSEWVIHYYGRRVRDVRSSWRTMISDLGYEGGRGWGAYVMRRSMSKLLRESGALAWDVQGLLGHRTAGTTEVYTDGVIFPTATANLLNIIANIEDKAGYCLSTFTPKSHLS
jgi:integrase